jgi:hypothetical protein
MVGDAWGFFVSLYYSSCLTDQKLAHFSASHSCSKPNSQHFDTSNAILITPDYHILTVRPILKPVVSFLCPREPETSRFQSPVPSRLASAEFPGRLKRSMRPTWIVYNGFTGSMQNAALLGHGIQSVVLNCERLTSWAGVVGRPSARIELASKPLHGNSRAGR